MPVKHIVLMKFKADTPADAMAKASANLVGLKGARSEGKVMPMAATLRRAELVLRAGFCPHEQVDMQPDVSHRRTAHAARTQHVRCGSCCEQQ